MAAETTKKSRQELQNEIKKQGEIVRKLKLETQTEELKQQVLIYLRRMSDFIRFSLPRGYTYTGTV